MLYLLGGKYGASIAAAEGLLARGIAPVVIPSGGEDRIGAFPSLGAFARQQGLTMAGDIRELYGEEVLFLSVEFDKLVHAEKFAAGSSFFNIHFSMLPAYRGTMTSFWPILFGERRSGVTLHLIDEGIDTGPVIAQRRFEIAPEATCRDLYIRYHEEAALLLTEEIGGIIDGSYRTVEQDRSAARSFPRFLYTHVPKEFTGRQLRLMERRDVHNLLRSLIFEEFQLPVVDRRSISRISLDDFPERNVLVPTNGGDLYARALIAEE